MSFFIAKDHGLDPKKRPNMQLINTHVIRKYAVYWENTGENLGMQHLDVIKLNKQGHPSLNEECFKEMLKKWLQIDVNANWEKLQKAINQAISNAIGTMETGKTAVHGSSEDSSIQIDAEGYDMSRPKLGKRKHDGDEDNARPTSSVPVNPAKISTDPDDEIDGTDQGDTGNQDDQQKKGTAASAGQTASDGRTKDDIIKDRKARTKYPVIHKKHPLYAVIIGNEKFDGSNDDLDGVDIDVERMVEFLETYGTRCNEERNLKADEMMDTLERLKRRDFTKYSGLIVTILTHGGVGNTLCGSDGKPVHLQQLAEIFNSVECKGLKDKPKIFIISACRGPNKDVAQSLGLPVSQSLQDSIPRGADFMFVQSCADDYKSYIYEHKGSPFIEHLVKILEEELKTKDLEHALLKVKEEVAKELINCGDEYCKQMPSVTSQMRYEVWWVK